MASTVAFTANTYAGEQAGPLIALALLSAPTIERNLLTVMPNIKKREILRLAALTVTLQAESCNFAATDSLTFDERYLDPVTMQVNYELCFKDLRVSWEAAKLRAGRSNETVPDDLGNFMVDQMGKKIANAIELLIWQGDTAGSSQLLFFDGLVKKMLADSTTIKQDAAVITSANVVAELTKVFNLIPETIKEDPNELVWAATPAIVDAYKLAQGAAAYGNSFNYLDDPRANFLGYPIERVNSLPANTMVVYRKPNVFFGTDLMSDFNEIRTVDMRYTTADKKVRYSADFAAAVNYAYGAEIVIYNPAVA
jgi:hypothetical protein